MAIGGDKSLYLIDENVLAEPARLFGWSPVFLISDEVIFITRYLSTTRRSGNDPTYKQSQKDTKLPIRLQIPDWVASGYGACDLNRHINPVRYMSQFCNPGIDVRQQALKIMEG